MENLCFFNSIKFWGGGEKLHLENALEFKKLGYKIIIASNRYSKLWVRAKEQELPTFHVSVGGLSFLNLFKILRLISFYRKNKIDAVVFSSSQDLKLGSLSAYLAGVSRIIYLRGLAVPIKASPINKFIFKKCLTHIIPNSDETKRNILKHLSKSIDENRIKTIYHGLDFSKVKTEPTGILEAVEKQGKGIILGNAGRLTAQKGQHMLIEAAKQLKAMNVEFTLFIAGTGELQPQLQSQIDQNELNDQVILLGFVKDMEKFMSSIDIFLLSSSWEGFGFVLVEAMIKSKPIVAFDISSNPEIVKKDRSGFLVKHRDIEAFVTKTAILIGDDNLRQEMGAFGQKDALKRFSLTDRVKEIESFILTTSTN
ncbi:MAG: glycosyltransferase [Flavobacteriales bacterium]|nr:glycosyltransferase [Flavobacteriales bacterium]